MLKLSEIKKESPSTDSYDHKINRLQEELLSLRREIEDIKSSMKKDDKQNEQ